MPASQEPLDHLDNTTANSHDQIHEHINVFNDFTFM